MNFDEIVKMDVHFFFYSFSFPECLMFFKMKIEEKKVNRSIFSEFEPWLSWHMPYIVFGSVSRTQFLVLETFLAQSFSSFLITVWLLLLILNTARSGKKLSLQPQLLGAFLVAT